MPTSTKPAQNVTILSEHVKRVIAMEAKLGIKYEEVARMARQLKAHGLSFKEACVVFGIETEHNPIDDLFAEAGKLGIGGGHKEPAHTDRELQPMLLAALKDVRSIHDLPPVGRIQH